MRKSKNDFYNSKDNRTIYVLLSPTDKIFYINQCLRTSVNETYRHNIKGRRASSKKFIDEISPQRPCIFILENGYLTKSEAYIFMLIWIKIFLENGYACFNSQKIIDQAINLNNANKQLYDNRKQLNLNSIISCNKCFIPIYKNIVCEKSNLFYDEMDN